MRGRDRIVLGLGLLMLVAGASAWLTVGHYGWRFFRATRELNSTLAVGQAEQEAFRAYRHGSQQEATHALLELAALLRAEEERSGRAGGRAQYAFDLSLTYARLALVAERAGSLELKERYMAMARTWFGRSGPQGDASEERMRGLVERADQAGDRGETGASARRATP